jgi:hypothetical protein
LNPIFSYDEIAGSLNSKTLRFTRSRPKSSNA